MSERATTPSDITMRFAAAVNDAGARTIYAARRSGLYRSGDEGATWQLVLQTAQDEPVTAVCLLSPSHGDEHPTVLAGGLGMISRSTGMSTSWQTALLPSPTPLVTSLAGAFLPDETGVAIAGTLEDGVFRSADSGTTWRGSNVGLTDMAILSIAVSPAVHDDGLVLIATSSGVFRSMNVGRSWRDLDLPERCSPFTAVTISPDVTHDGRVVVGSERGELLRSDDCGTSWSRLEHHHDLGEVVEIFLPKESSTDQLIIAAFGVGVIQTPDGGERWEQLNIQPPLSNDLNIVSAAVAASHGSTHALILGLSDGSTAMARSTPFEPQES